MNQMWKECILGDVVNLKRGYDLPNQNRKSGEIPIFSSSGITDYHDTAMKDGPGVITGRYGSIGKVFYTENPYWPLNTTLYVQDFKGNFPKFIFYFLQCLDYEKYSDKSAVPGINRNELHEEKVIIPPYVEQTYIAELLSSLDDKIDLLHCQNKILEQLSETLFRKHFLEINTHENLVSLGEYVKCFNGVSYKSNELKASKNALVTLKNFDRNGGFRLDGFKEFSGKFKQHQVVEEGDLIVAHTDITQEAEVIGNPVLVVSDPRHDLLIISMDLVKVIPLFDWFSIEFIYQLMLTREFKYHCLGNSNGSTVLHLNKTAIPSFEFQLPLALEIQNYTSIVKPIINKKFKNITQIRTLTQLRDTLLPKLMTGEIRVKC
ncbi:MAG: restriction endonuclease subunit S [Bacteroidota bacterium]